MARKEGRYGGPDRTDDYGGYADIRGNYFRQDREDRNIFRPLPRPDFRGSPRGAPNRQYDRYFPRSARR